MSELVLGNAGPMQERPGLHVMDDVHQLERDAGYPAEAQRLLGARCPEEEVLDLPGMRHLFGDAVTEGGAQVLHGLVEHVLDARPIEGIVRLEEAEPQVAVDVVAGLEMDAAPVDHRAAAQDDAHPLQVAERPGFRSGQRRTHDHARPD